MDDVFAYMVLCLSVVAIFLSIISYRKVNTHAEIERLLKEVRRRKFAERRLA